MTLKESHDKLARLPNISGLLIKALYLMSSMKIKTKVPDILSYQRTIVVILDKL